MRAHLLSAGVATLVVFGLAGTADAHAKCKGLPPHAKVVIEHPQSNIYTVQVTSHSGGVTFTQSVFYGCDLGSGRVTKLLMDNSTYADDYVVSHDLHATVLEGGETSDKALVAIWNLASGRADAVDRFTTSRVLELVDSPQGREVTAIVYRGPGHNVLDAVSSQGTFHLASRVSRVSVKGRTVSWTSGGRSHSRTV